jgi:NAD(P)-dependent dehydrogenase (short-subunit alcohol dehydrogenase family)
MQIAGSVALVTGANRGLGRAFAEALVARGAARVYAGARDPASVTGGNVLPVRLDVTSPADVADAAATCGDVTLLINNAGIARFLPLLDTSDPEAAEAEMATNYFGTLRMCRAFAPVLGRNGGGALVNMLSVVSWMNVPLQGSYSASKAAAWSLTQGVRHELKAQGTQVVGVYAGYIATDMTRGFDVAKASPEAIAASTLDGIEAGATEVLADSRSAEIKTLLRDDPGAIDRMMQAVWDRRSR